MINLYYKLIPYDYRPSQLWYRLKCRFWKKYTTIKPRYLKHTWCDRCELLSHMMFEILSQFIEKECSPGHIEWYGEYGHKIGDKYVRDIMQELYNWWQGIYNNWQHKEWNRIWKEIEKHMPIRDWIELDNDNFEYKPIWETKEDEKAYNDGFKKIHKLEDRMEKELKDNMHQLVEITPYLWT